MLDENGSHFSLETGGQSRIDDDGFRRRGFVSSGWPIRPGKEGGQQGQKGQQGGTERLGTCPRTASVVVCGWRGT